MIDTTRYYTILVDALANGNSSSPSNTPAAAKPAFDQLSIADMVEAEHRFVVEHLKLTRLHAVVGISMGGMQAFEWAVRYPDFLEQAISIMGSPRGTPFGALLLTNKLSGIETRLRSMMAHDSVWMELGRLTQDLVHVRVEMDGAAGQTLIDLRTAGDWMMRHWTLEDYAAQVGAVLRHDVSARYGGDLAQAAERVRARMLIVYSWEDLLVPAGDAAAFARLVHADTLSLRSACGHLAPRCEEAVLNPAVREFLAR
jgi:homoserine O-acetyltransferase